MEYFVKERLIPLKIKKGMNCKDRNLTEIVQGYSREIKCTAVFLMIH
jgi:hypothetical protein